RAVTEARPGGVLGEDDRAEVGVAAGARRRRGIAPQRIVAAKCERPVREHLGAALSARGAQVAGRAIHDLRGIVADLVGDDLVAGGLVERRRALRVALGGGVRLVGQVEVNRRRRALLERLAAVPHDRAEEIEVGGGQRPPEERQLVAVRVVPRVAVWVVDREELELGGRRDGYPHSTDALCPQHAVLVAARGGARRVCTART